MVPVYVNGIALAAAYHNSLRAFALHTTWKRARLGTARQRNNFDICREATYCILPRSTDTECERLGRRMPTSRVDANCNGAMALN